MIRILISGMTDTANPTREKIDQALTDLERLKMNVVSIEARYQILGDDFSNLCSEFLNGIKSSIDNFNNSFPASEEEYSLTIETDPEIFKNEPPNDAVIMTSPGEELVEPGRNEQEVEHRRSLEKEPSLAAEIKTKTIIKRKVKRKKTRNKPQALLQPGVSNEDHETTSGISNGEALQEPSTPGDENMPVIMDNMSSTNEKMSRPAVRAVIEFGVNEADVQDQSSHGTEPVISRDEIPEDDEKISRGHWFPGIQSLSSPQVYQSSLTDIIGTYTVNNIPKGDEWELPPPMKTHEHKNAIDVAADGIEKGLDFIGNCIIYPVDKIIRLFNSKPRSGGK